MSLYTFNEKSFIDKGVPISNNFILEHFTSGAYHPVLGTYVPIIGNNVFNMSNQINYPLWKIVDNLALSSNHIIEPLLREFTGNLIIKQGFSLETVGDELRHTFGKGFDIMIRGEESNMFYVAKEIQKIASKASGMNLIFGNESWVHIDVSKTKLNQNYNSSKIDLPTMNTIDLFTGTKEKGILSYRGF